MCLDEGSLKAAKETLLNRFGRIDGLVNGAGGNMPEGVLQPDEDIFSMNLDGMKKVLDLNLWGTLLPTQSIWRGYCQNREGQHRQYLVHEL
jgi:NAD(P)-dependent dehydrogenase (short-subunit alcohol dehydrogenase family)